MGLFVLTFLFMRVDFSPQQSVFEVVLWAVQVGVQPPALHPGAEKHQQRRGVRREHVTEVQLSVVSLTSWQLSLFHIQAE